MVPNSNFAASEHNLLATVEIVKRETDSITHIYTCE